MKKSSLVFFAAAFAILLHSCKLIDKLTAFEIDYSTTFSVPPTTILNLPIDLGTSNVTTNSEQTFNNNGTSGDHIREIFLKELSLTITSGENFSFLKSAIIYVEASGLPKIEVARIENNTSSGTSINLTPTTQDLKAYVIKPAFTISETITTQQATTSTITIRADAQFLVQGKLLK